jgi:hypothetical protein
MKNGTQDPYLYHLYLDPLLPSTYKELKSKKGSYRK